MKTGKATKKRPRVADMRDRVRFHREKADLSREELATKIGVHRSAITHIELGDVDPKISTLLKMCAAFGCTLGEFFEADIRKVA